MLSGRLPQKFYQLGTRGFPTNAMIEVTHRCNAKCACCYINKTVKKDELSLKQLFYVIDKLADSGILHLLITGGEPFKRNDILKILAYAVKRNFFGITINTNGLLLNKKHIAFFAANRNAFTTVKISIFSHIDRLNDSYFKINNAKQIILKNAEALKNAGIQVIFSLIVFDFNVDHYSETQSYFLNHGFPVSISPFKLVTDSTKKDFLTNSISETFFTKYLTNLPQEKFSDLVEKMREKINSTRKETGLCNGRLTAIMVDTDGSIAPCIPLRNLCIGNIFEKRSIHEIFNSSENHKKLKDIQKTDIHECKNCKFINFCDICLGRAYFETGSIYSVDRQTCNYAKALYNESNKL